MEKYKKMCGIPLMVLQIDKQIDISDRNVQKYMWANNDKNNNNNNTNQKGVVLCDPQFENIILLYKYIYTHRVIHRLTF